MKHNIREYNSRGIAGLVVRIKHPSGVERSVYVAEQCGMESDEPWLAVCETHGNMVSCRTQSLARASMQETWWCDGCEGSEGKMHRNSDRRNATMSFEQAKSRRDALESDLRHWTSVLDSYPKSAMGLTDELSKSTPEWREAKAKADRAFAELRRFNAWFTSAFKNELAEERRLRRSRHVTNPTNARYWVWVIGHDNRPKDEGPYGPYEFVKAKDFARIGATEGAHDRAVSIGGDPAAHGFQIVRRYRRGTGERVQ